MFTTTHKQILTTGDVARILRCAPRTAGKLIDRGLLKGWRMTTSTRRAGDRRVTRAALEEFCAEQGIPLEELERAARIEERDHDPPPRLDPPPAAPMALGLVA